MYKKTPFKKQYCIYVHYIHYTATTSILNVTEDIMLISATLDCTLPCFSPDLHCALFSIRANNANIMNTVITHVTSPIVGSVMSYSYPTQKIYISNLFVNMSYNYCVIAVNMNATVEVGEPVCDYFRTPSRYPHMYILRMYVFIPFIRTFILSLIL